MGKPFDEIDDEVAAFLGRQRVFFVATAPLSPDGHVNVSPKGLDTFRVLGPRTVAYLDLTGSGIETAAHLRENGRITLMFCAFEGRPRIVRLYGRGRWVGPGDAGWAELRAGFPDRPGARGVIVVELDRLADSCGYAVPLFEPRGDRRQLTDWAEAKGEDGLARYRARKNRRSIDGLPGLEGPPA